jgi:hypothetical protein
VPFDAVSVLTLSERLERPTPSSAGNTRLISGLRFFAVQLTKLKDAAARRNLEAVIAAGLARRLVFARSVPIRIATDCHPLQ